LTKLSEALDPGRSQAPTGSAYCLCESYARVTERAALGGARWLGRADQDAAREAAYSGMRQALEQMPISGRVVIGAEEDPEGLSPETELGTGGEKVDLAIDRLEGRGVVARGG
jgi:fructose-1,6-bisphosphatase II